MKLIKIVMVCDNIIGLSDENNINGIVIIEKIGEFMCIELD